jgi:hypothetical protein
MMHALVGAFLAVALLAPPLPAEPRYRLGPPAAFATAPADSAVIYLTREQFVRAGPLPPEAVYLDAAPLGLLPQRAFLAATVAPGGHVLWGLAGMPPFGIRCRAGHGTLLRLFERIDDQDQLRLEWLLDDPARIGTLSQGVPLALAITTPKGLRSMNRRAPEGWEAAARDPSGGLPLVVEKAWLEDPSRPGSQPPSFRRALWRAVVDSAGLLLTSGDYALAVPARDITAIYFAGARAGGDEPWLGVEYRVAGEPRALSLADSVPETAVRTYDLLFAALRDLWLARGGGEAGPGRGGADGHPAPE